MVAGGENLVIANGSGGRDDGKRFPGLFQKLGKFPVYTIPEIRKFFRNAISKDMKIKVKRGVSVLYFV